MDDVVGRVAVVTGAGSGMGRAMAQRFATAGMRVVVSDINLAAARSAADLIVANGAEAVAIRTDVSKVAEIADLATATLDTFGQVHVVCNNAGVALGGRVDELTNDEWRWMLDVDLWSAIHGVRIFLPLLERQGEGHIVSTASVAGMGAPPLMAPYAVAKAGVIALMESLRRELTMRSSPIGASVLCPSSVNTALMTDSAKHAVAVGDRSNTSAGDTFIRAAGVALANTGIEPSAVADMVLEAILSDRFWIITHPEWAELLRLRVDKMMEDGSLADRPNPPDL